MIHIIHPLQNNIMSKFTIFAVNSTTEKIHQLSYDNSNSSLHDIGKDIIYPLEKPFKKDLSSYNYRAFPLSKDNPAPKSRDFSTLKISLGLKCNYSCEYCSQRFVPGAELEQPFNAEEFVDKVSSNFIFGDEGAFKKIEFWGGEPLLYWNKIVSMTELFKEKYPKLYFSIITNGSLMTKEKADWLYEMGFGMAISHDGPGQKVRGPNPFDVPRIKEAILYLYNKMAPEGRISFNAMLNNDNTSRAAIQEYFVNFTGDPNVNIGEGGFVDAYDIGGLAMSLEKTKFKSFSFESFKQIRQFKCTNFITVKTKISGFFDTIFKSKKSSGLSQKCGMDKMDSIAIDLDGNVITCQNLTVNAVSPNGNSHKIGHIDDFDNISLNTATHWSHRKDCSTCPVLQLCQGSCMYIEGPLWDASCNNAYYDNIPYFCSVIEHMTGCVPIYIDGDLPEERKDIFGLFEDGKFSEETFDAEKFYEFLESV